MFARARTNDADAITVFVDGVATRCKNGDTVASVLLLDGIRPYRRTTISGASRAPYCMMGVCFECLVEIDGIANQQGCLRAVEPGMEIHRQMPAGAKARQTPDEAP